MINMDYTTHFRPLFSFGAHAARAAAGAVVPPPDPLAVFADAEELAEEARAGRRTVNADAFDAAWFAAAAWLDWRLAAPRRAAGVLAPEPMTRRHFGTDDAERDFFRRLDELLDDYRRDQNEPEHLSVVETYLTALELGYLADNPAPDARERLKRYRRRCREALAAAEPAPELAAAFAVPRPHPVRRPAGMALFWLVPLAVTVGMYLAYRFLLSNLYGMVVGS